MAAERGARRRRSRPEPRTLRVRDVDLAVAEAGPDDADHLVLLHGLAARWQTWGGLLPAMARRWRVIAPDFRGHGASGHAPGTYTLPTLVADTLAVIDATVPPGAPLWVYGHSLGGWVALWTAAERPDRVRGVVVGDTVIALREVDADAAVGYLANLPLALRSLATALRAMDPEVMEAFRTQELTAGYDPGDLLPRVRCPVLLLQGDPAHGGLMTDGDVATALELLPDARHVCMTGLGHGLHVEDPGRILEEVEAFLDPLRPGPSDQERPPPD